MSSINGAVIRGGTYGHEPPIGYDILPTVLDFAAPGLALPNGVEGGSWKPVLMNGGTGKVQRPIDRLVWHHDVEIEHPQTALRKGNLKLLHYWDTKEDFLYDLSTDLGERTSMATEKPALTAQLLAELKAHVRAGLGEQKFAALEAGKFEQGKGSPGGGKRPPGRRPPPQ